MTSFLSSRGARGFAALLNALFAVALLFLGGRILLHARFSLVVVLLVGAFAALALLGAVAAVGIWRGSLLGAFLTLVVQGTQLIQSQSYTLTYTSSLPVSLVVGIGADGAPRARATWRPALEITPEDDQDRPWIGLDLPALAAIAIAAVTLGRTRRMSAPGRP